MCGALYLFIGGPFFHVQQHSSHFPFPADRVSAAFCFVHFQWNRKNYLERSGLLLSSSIVGKWDVRRSVGRSTRIVRDDSFQTKR